MTLERDVIVDDDAVASRAYPPDRNGARPVHPTLTTGPDLTRLPTGRVVSLRFMRLALRRRRAVWLTIAVLGLLIGTGYGAFAPRPYNAAVTLYLSHPPNVNQTVAAQDDLAMLDTVTVGQRALARLGNHALGPRQLLGATPGHLVSDDILVVSISGATPREAITRADAVARAYLVFRARQYGAQDRAYAAGARTEIARLQASETRLTSEIATSQKTAQQLAQRVAQRAAVAAQIATLQQTVQQDALDGLALSKGSRIISPATVVPASRTKRAVVDGAAGLGAALALGIGVVLVPAVMSDRLRRREDVAAVLGVSVSLSVPRPSRSWIGWGGPGACRRRTIGVRTLARHLRDLLRRSDVVPATELVVSIDDARAPAAAMTLLCRSLSAAGERVVVVDATDGGLLRRALGAREVGVQELALGSKVPLTLRVPEAPWEAAGLEGPEVPGDELSGADAVLVLATVDLGVGAAHLRVWSSRAVVTLRAGGATAQRVDAVARLLDAAGIEVTSAVLLDADEDDESSGICRNGVVAAVQTPATPAAASLL